MARAAEVRWRAVAAALAFASMLVAIAMTATDPLSGTARDRLFEVDRTAVAAFARQALFVAYLAVLLHALYLWLTRDTRRERGEEQQKRLGLPLVLVALLVTVVYLSMSNLTFLPEGGGNDVDAPITSLPDPEVVPTQAPPASEPGSPWEVVAIAGVVVAVASYLLLRRSPPGDSGPPLVVASAAPAGSDVPVDDVPGSDPRSRIFAAYRRVETAAETAGRQRGRGETVGAHLRRLAPSAEALRLSAVYNRARFSRHVVDVSDAETAEASAREIYEALR